MGAGGAGDDHAARPLAGDEGDRPGPGRSGRAGRAAARRRRGRRRRRRAHRARSTSCGSATSCWCGPAVGSRPTGSIVDGEAELDESMITGESKPVAKGPGDRVVAGTVSTDSSIRVRVDAVGDDTALAGIQRLVADAQASHSRAQALADRFAALLFYVAVAAGVITFVAWCVARRHRRRRRAHRHGAGHRLPARPRAGDPAGHLAVDGGVGQGRDPRQGPARPGADAHDRHGAVRQDRHADQGRPRRHRRRRGGRPRRGPTCCASPAASSPTASTRSPGRSSPPPASRGEVPSARAFRALTGRGVEATIDGVRYAVGGPALLRERQLCRPR